jgi:hypothetical protein
LAYSRASSSVIRKGALIVKIFLALTMLIMVSACTVPGTDLPEPTPVTPESGDPEILIITTTTHPLYGIVIVDGTGRPLYMLDDDDIEKSRCTQCPDLFRAVMSKDQILTQGSLSDNLLGVNGDGHVAYKDHLLYTYTGTGFDGQGKDGKWWLINSLGDRVIVQ